MSCFFNPTFLALVLALLGSHAAGLPIASVRWGLRSSLSPDGGKFWVSQSKDFAFGFRSASHGVYGLAIWYANLDDTIVWVANRDAPVTSNASLNFTNVGELVLSDPSIRQGAIWTSNTGEQDVQTAEIQDTGNLVLFSGSNTIVWASFDSPTDTLLPGQPLRANAKLVARKSSNSYASGRYTLYFPTSGSVALQYNNVVYWSQGSATSPVSSSTFPPGAELDPSGTLSFYDDTNNTYASMLPADSQAVARIRRVTLDVDGVLRTYSWDESSRSWIMVWKSFLDVCARTTEVCGPYGVCIYDPEATCVCPPGFHVVDKNDLSQGCARNVPLSCNHTKYVVLETIDFPFNDYVHVKGVSMESCTSLCSNNCRCLAAVYDITGAGQCWLKSGKLTNGHSYNQYSRFFLKVSASDSSAITPAGLNAATQWGSPLYWQLSSKTTQS